MVLWLPRYTKPQEVSSCAKAQPLPGLAKAKAAVQLMEGLEEVPETED